MRKFLASLGILSLVLLAAAPVLAAEDYVTATVTPQVVAVSVDPTSVDYGILPLSTSDGFRSTAKSVAITATNDGNVTSDFTIRGSDASGVGATNWVLSSSPTTTGTVGADQYAHRFDEGATFTDTEAAALDNTLYKDLKLGVTDVGSADFVLEMNMPVSVTDTGDAKSTTVTVLATAT